MSLITILIALITITNAVPIPATTFENTRPPTWLHSATIVLVCYDVVAVGAFLWLWVCGYLVWSKREERMRQDREFEMVQVRSGRRPRGRHTLIESEMRRLGML
jgi:hypothetical protein